MQHFVKQLDSHTISSILNLYYNPGRGGLKAKFAVHRHFWRMEERWDSVRVLLEDMGCAMRRCDVVEVGVFAGDTSINLLRSLPLLHLYGVDPYGGFEDMPNADEHILAKAQRSYAAFAERARLFRNYSSEVAQLLGKLDLVFIDGAHHYNAVAQDLSIWGRKAKRVCGHDLDLFSGVARAVHEWSSGSTIWLLSGSMWFVDI